MAYISVNLTPYDPQPGSYTLSISDCASGSTSQIIATGLTNPDSFPYYFETTDYSGTSGSTCISYELIDINTGCKCENTVSLVTPTPTKSITPTPTPSTEPLTGGTKTQPYITLNANFFSGSTGTIVDLIPVSNFPVTADTEVSFTMKLKTTGGTEQSLSAAINISGNTSSGKQRLTFTSIPYNELQRYYTEFSSDRVDTGLRLNLNGNFNYQPTSFNPPPLVTHKWISCCNNFEIYAKVAWQETQVGGWVYNGNVVYHNGQCYVSAGQVNVTTNLIFYGPYSQSCTTSVCVDLCDNFSGEGQKFKVKAQQCCPPYNTYSIDVVGPDYPPNIIGDYFFLTGEMVQGSLQYPTGCYHIVGGWSDQQVENNLHVIEGFYSSCPQCEAYSTVNDPCTQTGNVYRARKCCTTNTYISVQLSVSSPINLSNSPGFFYNNSCWEIIYAEPNQNVPSVLITDNNYVPQNICDNGLCPDCPTPTATPTPSTTPSWTPVNRLVTLSGCCDNETYNVNITLNIETVVGDFISVQSNSNIIPSGCYLVNAINNQTATSAGIVTDNYGQTSCNSCLEEIPCLQKYTACSENCYVVEYPYQTVSYLYNGIYYNIPTVVNSPDHLSPLANANGVVTQDAFFALVFYYYGMVNGCDSIPWVCDLLGGPGGNNGISTMNILQLVVQWGNLETIVNEEISCPTVYTTGLNPILNRYYHVPQEDNCYQYVGNVPDNGQNVITFNINTNYTGCTECINTEVPTPTPSITVSPSITPTLTPTPSISITPTLTPTLTPTSTPTEFIYKVLLSGCCNNITYLADVQFTEQIVTGETFYWSGSTNSDTLIPQCYTILNFGSSIDAPIFNIDNSTPYADCAACLVDNPCNELYMAYPCCTEYNPILITVSGGGQPILGVTGIIYNGDCYTINEGSGSGTGVITVTSEDFIENLCDNSDEYLDNCNPCPSITPTLTPSLSLTPSTTPPVTPSVSITTTPSISISTTPTLTPSSTPYPSQNGILLSPCCNDTTSGVGPITLMFSGLITSVSEGDSIHWNGIPYLVQSTSVGGTSLMTIVVSDDEIFTGEVNNCLDSITASTEPCYSVYYSGCTTGNVYIGNGQFAYLPIGNYYTSLTVFGQYGDQCVEVIDTGNYGNNYESVSINSPLTQSNSCCPYPSSTPTTTPTTTPTPTITITPSITITPTPSTTPDPLIVPCGEDINISQTSFANVLNPDGTITSYDSLGTKITATLNLSSCAGTVKIAIEAQNIPDRFIIKNSSGVVFADSLWIGQNLENMHLESQMNSQTPYDLNTFVYNNSTSQLEYTGTESVSLSLDDFPYDMGQTLDDLVLYDIDNTWDDNGVIRNGAPGQIGMTTQMYNALGFLCPPGLSDGWNSNPPCNSCNCCGPNVGNISNDNYAICGGGLLNKRVIEFDVPATNDPFYTLEVYGSWWYDDYTRWTLNVIECPDCTE